MNYLAYFQLQYFVMSLVAMFIAVETEGYEMIHTLVSYSTAAELKRRLAMFACDVYIYNTALKPLGHQITNCTCLWSLIGKNISVLFIDASYFSLC